MHSVLIKGAVPISGVVLYVALGPYTIKQLSIFDLSGCTLYDCKYNVGVI